jgi:hypothetical protein
MPRLKITSLIVEKRDFHKTNTNTTQTQTVNRPNTLIPAFFIDQEFYTDL